MHGPRSRRPSLRQVPWVPVGRVRRPRRRPSPGSRRGRPAGRHRWSGLQRARRPRPHPGARPHARRGRRPGGHRDGSRSHERGRPGGAPQDPRGTGSRRHAHPVRGCRGPDPSDHPLTLGAHPPWARRDPRHRDAPHRGRHGRPAACGAARPDRWRAARDGHGLGPPPRGPGHARAAVADHPGSDRGTSR